jgi:hypothetical protein
MLLALGIIPSATGTQGNIEITGSRAVRLAKILSRYLTGPKRSKTGSVSCSRQGFDRDTGWNCGSILSKAREAEGTKHKDIPLSSNTFWRHVNGLSLVSERHMHTYTSEVFQDSQLKQLLSADCRWVRVEEISKLPDDDVFDLVCEGEDTRSFIANGLITHNCVLQIDELEKALSGTGSSDRSDSGTLARVFGTLLTAMEERLEDVCIVATANDVSALPAELIRRFNDLMFVDLPVAAEREQILKIHLEKRKRKLESLDKVELIKRSNGFTGAEIEKAVKEAIARSWMDGRRKLTTEDLSGAFTDTKPISVTMAEKIDVLRDWARGRARYASSHAEEAASPGNQKVVKSSGDEISLDDLEDDIPATDFSELMDD